MCELVQMPRSSDIDLCPGSVEPANPVDLVLIELPFLALVLDPQDAVTNHAQIWPASAIGSHSCAPALCCLGCTEVGYQPAEHVRQVNDLLLPIPLAEIGDAHDSRSGPRLPPAPSARRLRDREAVVARLRIAILQLSFPGEAAVVVWTIVAVAQEADAATELRDAVAPISADGQRIVGREPAGDA